MTDGRAPASDRAGDRGAGVHDELPWAPDRRRVTVSAALPRPRLWLLLAGAWIALTWVVIAGLIATDQAGGAVVLLLTGVLPVGVVWRILLRSRRRAGWQGRYSPLLVLLFGPLRDAWAELRAWRGKGRGSRV